MLGRITDWFVEVGEFGEKFAQPVAFVDYRTKVLHDDGFE